jgi:hypothetical protein
MGASTKTDPTRETWISRITPERTVGVYLGILVVVAIVAQAISSIPPSEEGSPIETFTTGLLWMLSFVALLSAFHASSRPRDMWFWLASSAGLAALAIDEAIGVHERTEPAGLNDDFVKVILWLGTPLLLRFVARMDGRPFVARIFAVGYLVHTLYLVVELGDGEFFTLPPSPETLKWSEEIFELLFLTLYMAGFALRYLRAVAAQRKPAEAESGTGGTSSP